MMHDTTTNQGTTGTPRVEERTIPLPAEGLRELTIHNVQGQISVRGTDRGDVFVRAIKTGSPASRRFQEARLEVDAHRGRIRIQPHGVGSSAFVGLDFGAGPAHHRGRGERRSSRRFGFDLGPFAFGESDEVAYDIEVEIPRPTPEGQHETEFELRNASGDIRLEEARGTARINTASGDIALRTVGGDLTITTASGDVGIVETGGSLHVRSVSGDTRISGGTLTVFDLTTVSGDLSVEADVAGFDRCTVQGVSGDVRLTLGVPAAPGSDEPYVTLDFKTASGDANVAAPFRRVGRKIWHCGPGEDGGVRIGVKTVSGDLQASCHLVGTAPTAAQQPTEPIAPPPTAPTPPAPPTAPTPPAPPTFAMGDAQAAMDRARAAMDAALAEAARARSEARAAMGVAANAAIGADEALAGTQSAPAQTDATGAAQTVMGADDGEAAPISEEERLAVLQALERGEIDVEEALNRLEGAEPDANQNEEPEPEADTEPAP